MGPISGVPLHGVQMVVARAFGQTCTIRTVLGKRPGYADGAVRFSR